MLLPKILGRFKMNSAKRINAIQNTAGRPVWQRNYFDHIIRNERSLNRICHYITDNPARWQFDRENAARERKDEFDAWLEFQGRISVSHDIILENLGEGGLARRSLS